MENDRYLSINELPYIQQLARQMQYNMYASPYQNNNQALQYVMEVAKIIEAQKRNIPDKYNLNLQNKRMKTGDIQFNLPHLNIGNMMRQGYQQGPDLIPYRDTEFSSPSFFRIEPVRGPQTQSTGASL